MVGTFLGAAFVAVIILFGCLDELDPDIYQRGCDIDTMKVGRRKNIRTDINESIYNPDT